MDPQMAQIGADEARKRNVSADGADEVRKRNVSTDGRRWAQMR
jgi:hypothetical protein